VETDISSPVLSGRTLILVGGPKTNMVTRSMSEASEPRSSVYDPLIVDFYTSSDSKAMSIYSKKEVSNRENSALTKSPLAAIMDPRYVPVAATSMSLLLLYLWNMFGKIMMEQVNDFVSSKISDKAMKGRKVRHVKAHEFLNWREVLAFLATVAVFSLVLSWTWSHDIDSFLGVILLNLGVVLSVSFLREAVRILFCYKMDLRAEYIFWPFGAFLTLASTALGNTFSMVSYTLLEEGIEDEKRFGKLSFFISIATILAAVVSYAGNIFFPSLALQMLFVYCMMLVFIELFPMPPFAGSDIFKWNRWIWGATYIATFLLYIMMNFTLYL